MSRLNELSKTVAGLARAASGRFKIIGGKMLGGQAPAGPAPYYVKVLCNQCGETLEVRVNLNNDLSAEFDESGDATGFTCRKILRGNGRCSQSVEVLLSFDTCRKLVDAKLQSGRIASE